LITSTRFFDAMKIAQEQTVCLIISQFYRNTFEANLEVNGAVLSKKSIFMISYNLLFFHCCLLALSLSAPLFVSLSC